MRTNHACPVQVKDAVPSLVLGAKRVYCIYAEFDAPYLTNIEIAVYGWWAGTKDMVHDPSRTGYDCVVTRPRSRDGVTVSSLPLCKWPWQCWRA